MSSHNILRLLRDALVLHGDRLDLVAGNILKIRPLTDDTGSVNVGDGTYDLDVKVFLGSTGKYVLFDVGNSQLELACPIADPVVAAEHGAGVIGTAATPATSRRTVNGTIITEFKIDLTGLASVAAANDVIGLAAGGAAIIGRNVVATNGIIHKIEFICLETPTGGDDDINLVSGSAADNAYDDAVTDAAVEINGGDQVAGMVSTEDAPAVTANYYFYLTAGTGDVAGTFSAGMFVIRLHGHPLLS